LGVPTGGPLPCFSLVRTLLTSTGRLQPTESGIGAAKKPGSDAISAQPVAQKKEEKTKKEKKKEKKKK